MGNDDDNEMKCVRKSIKCRKNFCSRVKLATV